MIKIKDALILWTSIGIAIIIGLISEKLENKKRVPEGTINKKTIL